MTGCPLKLPGSCLVVAGLAVLCGCIDSKKLREAFDPCAPDGCAPPPPQDCASLPAADWAVDGYLTAPESQVPLGGSARVVLAPVVEPHCSGVVVSVEWHADDPSVVSLVPDGHRVWVSGLTLGSASLGARINFGDGSAREARPRRLVVVALPPPQGQVIVQGELTIPPYVPPGNALRNWSGWVPFTTATAGRIDVTVDWMSPLNRIDFSGYEGHCNAIGACGRIRLTVREYEVKPLHSTFDDPRTPAGDYTIRIDNLGPGEETVRVEVRLTPS